MNIRAPIGRTGYGIVGLNLVKEAVKANPNTRYFPIGNPQPENHEDAKLIQKAVDNTVCPDKSLPGLTVWHEFDQAVQPVSSKHSALVFFEKDRLDNRAIDHLNLLDEVFVASLWAKKVLHKHGIYSSVVPMGVDTSLFVPTKPRDNAYYFFSVGKIEVRKGHHLLADWFSEAFSEDDNVRLVMNWANPFMTAQEHKEWEDKYRSTKLGHKILFMNTNTQQEVVNLIGNCHCGLFPTASEGFGLNILEAIAMNKPVITTDYSAMPDFCQQQNTVLCKPDGIEAAVDNKWFFGEACWAKRGPKYKEQFISGMQHMYKNWVSENPGYQETLQTFNWPNSYQMINNLLK